MSEWQPIETAPKGRTPFQAWFVSRDYKRGWWQPMCRYSYDREFGEYMIEIYDPEGGNFQKGQGEWVFAETAFWRSRSLNREIPTHWMPLLTRPKKPA